MKMMENLPGEMVTEILSRLPVESIIQCKLVRKSWYRLFTNPNFISKHVAHQSHSNNLVFLKRRVSCLDGSKRDIMCLLSSDNVDDPEIVNVPSSIQLPGKGLRLIGHCDGLIALSDNRDGIIVCNFTTREFRTLPNSSFGLIPFNTRVDDGAMTLRMAFISFLGFGYDSKINDYKIVRVVSFYTYGPDKEEFNHRAEVFSVRTDSCWRELHLALDFSQTFPWDFNIREPYFDGACYWWVKNYENRMKTVLLSFHMADEVFVKIPMPALACFKDYETGVSVGSYNKTMALYILSGRDPRRIEIWVMKELGVEESWSKQHTIDPFVGYAHLGFWNGTDKEFLYVDRDRQIAIYDRVTKQSKSLSLPGVSETWVATPYMKTIVSVKSQDDISLLSEDLANFIF